MQYTGASSLQRPPLQHLIADQAIAEIGRHGGGLQCEMDGDDEG